MLTTLRLDAPEIEARRLERPLLSIIHKLDDKYASIAMRAWWGHNTETDIAQHGLRIWYDHIRHHNNAQGSPDIPALFLPRTEADGHCLLLAVFADASAAVLRSVRPIAMPIDKKEVFSVLPIPLKLSSAIKPNDGRPNLSLRVRKSRTANHTPYVTLARGKQGKDDPFVNLVAGNTVIGDGIDHDLRESVYEDLLDEVAAWADLIDQLPVLHVPQAGRGFAHEGTLGTTISPQLGFDANSAMPYACPAFLPYATFTPADIEGWQTLSEEFATWLLLISPAEIERIDTSLLSAVIPTTKKDSGPRFRINAFYQDGQSQDALLSGKYTEMFERLLRSDLAPAPFERLIGQRVSKRPGRMDSGHISPCDIAYRHKKRSKLSLSRHLEINLHQKFGRFLPNT